MKNAQKNLNNEIMAKERQLPLPCKIAKRYDITSRKTVAGDGNGGEIVESKMLDKTIAIACFFYELAAEVDQCIEFG